MIARNLQRLFSNRKTFNFKPEICYYKALNVSSSDDAAQIRKAYLSQTKKYHPDINPSFEKEYMAINEAYDILSDPVQRRKYDREKGINDPDWNDESYWYVDKEKKTENVYTKEDPEVEEYAKREATRKREEYTKGEKEHNYFKNKYFDNPEFTAKPADDPMNFEMWLEKSKAESNFQKGEDYEVFFAKTTKEYFHKKEELEGHEYPILRAYWELRLQFFLAFGIGGTLYLLQKYNPHQVKKGNNEVIS